MKARVAFFSVLVTAFAASSCFAQSGGYSEGFTFTKVPDLLSGTSTPHKLVPRNAPAAGETFFDDRFGTVLTCATEADYIHNRHEYSRFDPFNRDHSRIILDPERRWRVYSTAAYPYNRLENLVMEIDLEEPRWDQQDPNLIWGLYDFQIRTVNVETKETVVVKDFSADPTLGPLIAQEPVYRITTRDEGETSTDKRYWVFFLQGDERIDYVHRYIFTWDHKTDQIIGLYEIAPNEVDVDYVGLSPLGNWVIIGGDDYNQGNLKGLTVANRELTDFRHVGFIGHQDVGLTTDSLEVLVGQNTATDYVDVVLLGPNLQSIPLIRLLYEDASPYGMQSGLHVSCNMPGYCVISTYIEAGLPEKNWLDRSIILVKLDLSEPTGYYLAKVYGTTGSYYEETHATITTDGSKVVWASNWNKDVGLEQVFLMQLDMPPNWVQLVGVDDPRSEVPETIRLMQNSPNPFNPRTTIRYTVPTHGLVSVAVFDVLGNKVDTILNKQQPAGSYEVELAMRSDVSSGVYFYQLRASGFVETKKMVLLK